MIIRENPYWTKTFQDGREETGEGLACWTKDLALDLSSASISFPFMKGKWRGHWKIQLVGEGEYWYYEVTSDDTIICLQKKLMGEIGWTQELLSLEPQGSSTEYILRLNKTDIDGLPFYEIPEEFRFETWFTIEAKTDGSVVTAISKKRYPRY